MEAVVAFGLAANILQFVEFTGQLISSAQELSRQGAKTKYLELESIAKELRRLAEGIGPSPAKSKRGQPDAPDELQRLANRCIEITNELLSVLDSLKLQKGSKKWKSFHQALNSVWKTDQIKDLEERMDRISQALHKEIMTSEQRQITGKLDRLAAENGRLEAGRTEDIKDLKSQLKMAFIGLQKELEPDESRSAPMSVVLQVAEKEVQYSAEQLILDKLRFDSMQDRYEGVSSAHYKTLSWVFGSQKDAPLSSFAEWLTSADDLFWVSGKPGSGKSTLMKYLCTHDETSRRLQVWAKDNRLIITDFFVWSAARKSLQKSQQGLLRSLIYNILRQSPKTTEKVYPEIGQLSRLGGTVPNPPTSVPGLISVLRRVCESLAASGERCCFFIDGLDEFEGQPRDIIELIGVLRSIPNVKICISSRPWNEFEQSFGRDGSRKLYMQDLTRQDIRHYVSDVFAKDDNYQALMDDEEEAGRSLVNEIIECAQGVFLWVVLVVRSFQEGLTNGDRIADLQARLRELPRDLNDYFEKILLSDVAEFYRRQSARMFAAALNAKDRLPVMTYWFMEPEDAEYALSLEVGPPTLQQMSKRLEQTRKRLNACCKGLLEARSPSQANNKDMLPYNINFGWKVDFLHRTVKDFLAMPETQAFLSGWNPRAFDTDANICAALLAQIKGAPQEYEYFTAPDQEYEYFTAPDGVLGLTTLFLDHCRVLDDDPDCEPGLLHRLLDQLDATLHRHGEAMGHGLYHNMLHSLLFSRRFAETFVLGPPQDTTFLQVCAKYRLRQYVERKLGCLPDDDKTREALLPRLLRMALEITDRPLVQLILNRPTSPNDLILPSFSNWTLFMRDLHEGGRLSHLLKAGDCEIYLLVRDLLEGGADAGAMCSFGFEKVSSHRILRGALLPEHMALLNDFFAQRTLVSAPTLEPGENVSLEVWGPRGAAILAPSGDSELGKESKL
ncbi:hypothetical protein C8A01DRAFT_49701 [Parachaetomium inaequale]|uniref:NACHT domain-containing protein n=1 Tax=Parachaetomium inaequale TaxID=2588326 RepID=A0AAN6SMF0_9PEZI|nr:hypothetical protein C8A01DRAFT_49701 [Parachaetomium inaequale]